MAEVTNAKAAVFNFFNIGSALLNAMALWIYSLHEPDVYVIAKGKDHKQYEYGNKVSIVSTKDTNIIVGVASHDKK
jgi:Na+/H+-translocating membrane pyrophosphatase